MTSKFIATASTTSTRILVRGGRGSWNCHPQKRLISSQAARALLGLPPTKRKSASATSLTLKELRHAYFAAAKKCHPDVVQANNNDNGSLSLDFLQLTRAYELLQGEITQNPDFIIQSISTDEEEEFREACQKVLGIKAEIVEECKQNPMFRKWLIGRTDAAAYWQSFFTQHGGLAPKLRPKQYGGQIAAGTNHTKHGGRPSHTTRRKRK